MKGSILGLHEYILGQVRSPEIPLLEISSAFTAKIRLKMHVFAIFDQIKSVLRLLRAVMWGIGYF